MFKDRKVEKAITALIDEAEALAEKLVTAKPHFLDSHASFAQVWQATYLLENQDLYDLKLLKPDALKRFISKTETRIAALRKQREYDSSDGLAVWLHTARAIREPRIAPAVRQIWQSLMTVGPNADSMTDDLLQDADLPPRTPRRVPQGFETAS
jgi:hypothetical protein